MVSELLEIDIYTMAMPRRYVSWLGAITLDPSRRTGEYRAEGPEKAGEWTLSKATMYSVLDHTKAGLLKSLPKKNNRERQQEIPDQGNPSPLLRRKKTSVPLSKNLMVSLSCWSNESTSTWKFFSKMASIWNICVWSGCEEMLHSLENARLHHMPVCATVQQHLYTNYITSVHRRWPRCDRSCAQTLRQKKFEIQMVGVAPRVEHEPVRAKLLINTAFVAMPWELGIIHTRFVGKTNGISLIKPPVLEPDD